MLKSEIVFLLDSILLLIFLFTFVLLLNYMKLHIPYRCYFQLWSPTFLHPNQFYLFINFIFIDTTKYKYIYIYIYIYYNNKNIVQICSLINKIYTRFFEFTKIKILCLSHKKNINYKHESFI